VDRLFRSLQFVSASLYSLGHGGNDAQKTMGVIAVLLYAHAGGQGGFHVAELAVAVEHKFHRRPRICLHFLGDGGQYMAGLNGDFPRIDGEFPGDQSEKARLACAIGAHHSHSIAIVETEGGANEQRPRASSQGDVAERDHGSRRTNRGA